MSVTFKDMICYLRITNPYLTDKYDTIGFNQVVAISDEGIAARSYGMLSMFVDRVDVENREFVKKVRDCAQAILGALNPQLQVKGDLVFKKPFPPLPSKVQLAVKAAVSK